LLNVCNVEAKLFEESPLVDARYEQGDLTEEMIYVGMSVVHRRKFVRIESLVLQALMTLRRLTTSRIVNLAVQPPG
jgi:hypothetical protein